MSPRTKKAISTCATIAALAASPLVTQVILPLAVSSAIGGFVWWHTQTVASAVIDQRVGHIESRQSKFEEEIREIKKKVGEVAENVSFIRGLLERQR